MTSSSVREVVPSFNGGKEFCSTCIVNHSGGSSQHYLGMSPVAGDAGYTGVVESIDVCFDSPTVTYGLGCRLYVEVVNAESPDTVFQTLQYCFVRVIDPERPMFVKFREPLNFVCPPGYFLCCHFRSFPGEEPYLATGNIRWRSFDVVLG